MADLPHRKRQSAVFYPDTVRLSIYISDQICANCSPIRTGNVQIPFGILDFRTNPPQSLMTRVGQGLSHRWSHPGDFATAFQRRPDSGQEDYSPNAPRLARNSLISPAAWVLFWRRASWIPSR